MIGILTEKPSAARNFSKALGGGTGTYNGEQYVIVAARGHLFEFDDPEKQVPHAMSDQYKSWDLKYLPWNERDFSWKRVKKPDCDDVLKIIKQQLSKCDEICIATDVDPTGEGELLAWEILDELGFAPKRWTRMYFTDEAPKSIQKAFVGRKPIRSMQTDMDFVKADFRAKFDYLTMQFTRIATKCGDGRSVLRQGRLKSAMVQIVGDQLKLLSEYKKVPYYQNRFRDDHSVIYTDPNEPVYPKKDSVPHVYHASSVVVDSKTMKSSPPPKMLDLAALSARLSSRGFKAKQVLDVYQKMYESQIVSYPRTEDKVITPEQFDELLPLVDKIAALVNVDPRILTHRKPRSTHVKTGGAHGANRPGPNVPKSLTDLGQYDGNSGLAEDIYVLLARNYLATLAEDYEYEAQKGRVKDYPSFVGTASVPKKMGWRLVFDAEDPDEDEVLSGLGTEAEPFVYEGFPPKPATPTMKWLMKQLEKHDVGTGATRTSIYADVTNEKSKYPLLIESKGKLRMAPCGDMSYKLLPNTNIGDLRMTEQLQSDMRGIADGKLDPAVCLAKVQSMVKEDLKIMADNGIEMKKGSGVAGVYDYASGMWNGREIRFKRNWAGHAFTDDEVERLLNGETIALFGVQGKSGVYNVRGHLEESEFNGKPFVGFKATGYLNDDGSEKTSTVNSDDYYTGNWKRHGEVKFKRVFSGHRFTDEECEQLLAGLEISFDAVSSAGKDYVASGKLAKQSYKGRDFVGFKLNVTKK